MDCATKVCKTFQDFNVLTTRMNRLYCFIYSALSYLPLGKRGKKPPTPAGRQKSNCTRTKRYHYNSPNQAETSNGVLRPHLWAPPGNGGSPRATREVHDGVGPVTSHETRGRTPLSPFLYRSKEWGAEKPGTQQYPGRQGREGREPGSADSMTPRSRPEIPLVVRGRPVTGSRNRNCRSHPRARKHPGTGEPSPGTRRGQDDGEGGFGEKTRLFNRAHRTPAQDQTPTVFEGVSQGRQLSGPPPRQKGLCWAERRDAKGSTSGVPHRRQRAAKRSGRSCHSTDEPQKRDRASAHTFSTPAGTWQQLKVETGPQKAEDLLRKGQQKGGFGCPLAGETVDRDHVVHLEAEAVPSGIGFDRGKRRGTSSSFTLMKAHPDWDDEDPGGHPHGGERSWTALPDEKSPDEHCWTPSRNPPAETVWGSE
ncbi:hypothetical protein GWK47_050117 [Chionoecetes opilio]|uniref:Uncharacterized protein n=1 Tax=Chionoecetes opilio TaxID=41210 RepID=A0A8J4YAA8_CHIOP|nr:hypothetical protein GWK47_050117 [Chionoecetes opilio]